MRLALGAVWLLLGGGCGPSHDQPSADGDGIVAPPRLQPGPTSNPLGPGELFPALSAEGWLNGTPRPLDSPGVRLTVVDVWANWCPFCRQSAPGLVRVHQKFAARGVAFVSLTNMPRLAAERFVNDFSVPWPNGYGVSGDDLASLRAESGQVIRGYEVAPIVYVVGPDGRVRWSDRQGRFRHTDPKVWEGQLDSAIEAALANPAQAER